MIAARMMAKTTLRIPMETCPDAPAIAEVAVIDAVERQANRKLFQIQVNSGVSLSTR